VFDTVAIPGDGLKAAGSLVATMRLGLLLIASVLLAGCGADTPPPKPQKPVQLNVSAPSDTAIVQGATAQVSGTVSPSGARVKVQGHLAQVSGNSFTSTVNLAQGPNVIDVAATARGRATALTAFRVTRDERVAVPELVGLALDDATKQAEQRDLKLTAERGGGFLDPLVPRGIHVCDQSPAPGKQVRRGTTVKLLVARSC
jgi:Glucodextranase, domain B/PASTA domain